MGVWGERVNQGQWLEAGVPTNARNEEGRLIRSIC